MSAARPRSEKRQRNKVALVRMNEAEHQALTAAMAKTGKGASTLLRDAFLAGENEAAIRAPLEAEIAKLRGRLEFAWGKLDEEAAQRIGGYLKMRETICAVAARNERQRIAASLRSLNPLAFLRSHGLEPGAGCAPILGALADEIEGSGDRG